MGFRVWAFGFRVWALECGALGFRDVMYVARMGSNGRRVQLASGDDGWGLIRCMLRAPAERKQPWITRDIHARHIMRIGFKFAIRTPPGP